MGLRNELLVGLRSALATTAGLFGAQLWYASYLDVAVVHGSRGEAPPNAQLQATREQEHTQLAAGPLPIEQAMAALAQQGRSAFPQLAVRPSQDLSAMSGWAHRPGFEPYVPAGATPAGAGGKPAAGKEEPADGK